MALAFSGCLIRKVDEGVAPGPDEVCVEITIEIIDEDRRIGRISGLIDLPD